MNFLKELWERSVKLGKSRVSEAEKIEKKVNGFRDLMFLRCLDGMLNEKDGWQDPANIKEFINRAMEHLEVTKYYFSQEKVSLDKLEKLNLMFVDAANYLMFCCRIDFANAGLFKKQHEREKNEDTPESR